MQHLHCLPGDISLKVTCSDADRNCISNVRPEGLGYAAAAGKLMWLAKAAAQLKISGVGLKDESDVREIGNQARSELNKL